MRGTNAFGEEFYEIDGKQIRNVNEAKNLDVTTNTQHIAEEF